MLRVLRLLVFPHVMAVFPKIIFGCAQERLLYEWNVHPRSSLHETQSYDD